MTTRVHDPAPAPDGQTSELGPGDAPTVVLTASAAARVRYLLERERRPASAGLRISVRDGGCSGLSYALALADAPEEGDLVTSQGGVRVFVDRASERYLGGLRLDFADGLHGAGFRFENPNAERTCGCGSSFAVSA